MISQLVEVCGHLNLHNLQRLANPYATMKLCGSEESQRLGRLLEDALAREARLWKAPVLENDLIQVKYIYTYFMSV